ncbi:unnamed protein product, partial [Choristocarpus tenellus]
ISILKSRHLVVHRLSVHHPEEVLLGYRLYTGFDTIGDVYNQIFSDQQYINRKFLTSATQNYLFTCISWDLRCSVFQLWKLAVVLKVLGKRLHVKKHIGGSLFCTEIRSRDFRVSFDTLVVNILVCLRVRNFETLSHP